MEPSAYPEPGSGPVERISTHISDVFLAGGYAYKVKKPLALPFLDFSTLADRRRYCEEELRVNRRLAPALYLDVVPICGAPNRPRVGGTGEAFEFAVKMVQFDNEGRLDHLAEQGGLDVPSDSGSDLMVIVNAAVLVCFDES